MARTVAFYRRAVRLLATIALTHWSSLGKLQNKERLTALERLFHATKDNPLPHYARIDVVLGKMPSYLRRAAINAAGGVVSSFLSNYDNWLDDPERELGTRPPHLGFSNVFPPLYGGNMLLDGNAERKVRKSKSDRAAASRLLSEKQRAALASKVADFATPAGCVRIKLLGVDGQWRFSAPLRLHGRFKRLHGCFDLSPTLVLQGAKAFLACPAEVPRTPFVPNKMVQRVLAVDVGINTAATLAVVDSTGTVMSRRFLTCGKHNDQRDNLSRQISRCQRRSGGGSGSRLGTGFCRHLYRRIAGLNLDAARRLAHDIIAQALAQKVQALVVEDLKGWKPRGSSRRQRQRFHRFQHRMIVRCLEQLAQEHGLRLLAVYARGTSRYAFDGSGKVERDRDNAANATFSNGKRFNADLNAAYNVAARGIALLHDIKKPEEKSGAGTGKSPGPAMRVPFVLADLWAHAQWKAAAH